MEFNEISMLMDVKLDIYDKRPESLKFKSWTKCQVTIEAIKCLPCFLRLRFQSVPQDNTEQSLQLTVSVNVPGVTISLATSRFKQHSYGLFWTHNRRDCFIYFALDTEMSCRKHMKWIKKSIKNLELYRQISLEQKRSNRGADGLFCPKSKLTAKKELSAVKNAIFALGPLPKIPDDRNSFEWSERASEIYEEILEESVLSSRLSRRLSRTSIASGIYEEMKPCSVSKNVIAEEEYKCPPPLPPLPAHRKRINTTDTNPFGILGNIPRCNTNPETDLAKTKRNKNVLENLLVGGRSKRAESVSETTACTFEDIISDGARYKRDQSAEANAAIKKPSAGTKRNRRTSFSSPDLSKINFLDTFDEEKLADLLHLNISSDLDDYVGDDLDCDEEAIVRHYSTLSLDESSTAPSTSLLKTSQLHDLKSATGSMETLNISAKLPQNFNFSACNTSTMNLMGASSAVPSITELKRNKLVVEDELSGYCIMAPIATKQQNSQDTITATTSSTTSSTTSGYSTGSYTSPTSSSSSNTQVTDNREQLPDNFSSKKNVTNAPIDNFYDQLPKRKAPLPVAECEKKIIYENFKTSSSLKGSKAGAPTANKNFAGNLYENLLTVKAALELEQPMPSHVCTSNPIGSPAEQSSKHHTEASICKTPRKSLISVSVDDKIPSYYPNSCDTIRVRQRTNSPATQTTPTLLKTTDKGKSCLGLKNLVSIKLKGERKESSYISSPQKIIEQRRTSSKNAYSQTPNTSKAKKSTNAQKISENVYTVNLARKTNNNNNKKKSPYKEANEQSDQLKEKLQNELLQLALLQKIDFKFDDSSSINSGGSCTANTAASSAASESPPPPTESGLAKLEQAELEYENCYQASKEAARLLHKYAATVPKQSLRVNQQLLLTEDSKQETLMSQSAKVASPLNTSDDAPGTSNAAGSKKFASLPRFKKIDFSPLKLKINNVLQRNQNQDA